MADTSLVDTKQIVSLSALVTTIHILTFSGCTSLTVFKALEWTDHHRLEGLNLKHFFFSNTIRAHTIIVCRPKKGFYLHKFIVIQIRQASKSAEYQDELI